MPKCETSGHWASHNYDYNSKKPSGVCTIEFVDDDESRSPNNRAVKSSLALQKDDQHALTPLTQEMFFDLRSVRARWLLVLSILGKFRYWIT